MLISASFEISTLKSKYKFINYSYFVSGAGGNGSVVFALVVDRHFEWKNAQVTLLEPRRIRVQDVATETLQD